jgi:hypothetical protein
VAGGLVIGSAGNCQMDSLFDVLLNPYHFVDEIDQSAFTPQEIQAFRKKKKEKSYAPMAKDFSK